MKKIGMIGLLAASLALADGSSVAGKWKVHSSASGNESNTTCEFTQKDTAISGTCTTSRGKVVPVSGKVDGQNVTWTYKSEYDGGPLTLTYKGKFATAKTINGSLTVEEMSIEGEFSATLAE